MLGKLIENLKTSSTRDFPSRGIVVDNEDPKYLGRIKCEIVGRWPKDSVDKLPWCFPFNPYTLGGSCKTGSFSVPELGAEVLIVFPYDDEYAPFYTAFTQNETTHPSALWDEDYPETYGACDSQMAWFRTNKEQGYHEIFNVCGFTARMYDDGHVHINVPRSLTVHVGEDLLVRVEGKEVWEIKKTSSKIVEQDTVLKVNATYSRDVATGTSTKTGVYRSDKTTGLHYESITGDHHVSITGLENTNITGAKNTSILGGETRNILGGSSHSVEGIEVETTIGDKSVNIAGADIRWVLGRKDLNLVGMRVENLVGSDYLNITEGNKYATVSGDYVRKAEGVISDEASEVHHNSGFATVTYLNLPTVPSYFVPAPALGPDVKAPIGHGTLEAFISELLTKVEELIEIDETLKDLDDVMYEIRTLYTTLGSDEFLMKEAEKEESTELVIANTFAGFQQSAQIIDNYGMLKNKASTSVILKKATNAD